MLLVCKFYTINILLIQIGAYLPKLCVLAQTSPFFLGGGTTYDEYLNAFCNCYLPKH